MKTTFLNFLNNNHFRFLLHISILLFGLSSTLLTYAADTIDLSKLQGDAQQKFKNLSKDIHAFIAYEDSQPAVSKSGIIPFGFETGFNISHVDVKSADVLKEVGFDVPTVILPRLYTEINVFSFGVAATYTPLYDGVSIIGYKGKYSIFDGSLLFPAVAVNINYASLNGVDTLKSSAFAYNLGVSKGFAFVTVYGNLGVSHGSFDPKTSNSLNLKKVENQETEAVLGARFGLLGVANLGLQLHSIGEHKLGTINFGIGF